MPEALEEAEATETVSPLLPSRVFEETSTKPKAACRVDALEEPVCLADVAGFDREVPRAGVDEAVPSRMPNLFVALGPKEEAARTLDGEEDVVAVEAFRRRSRSSKALRAPKTSSIPWAARIAASAARC